MWKWTVLLAGISALGPLTTDTYFPYFPELSAAFGVSLESIQTTLTFYLIGFALMMPFQGSISDVIGRRRTILVALATFIGATLVCAGAPTFELLCFARLAQGVSAGVGVTIIPALVQERFPAAEARRQMAHVSMMFALAPAVAPAFGGWLALRFTWPACFVFLAVIALAMLVFSLRSLEESLPVEQRKRWEWHRIVLAPWALLGERDFLLRAVERTCATGGLLFYVASAPDYVLNVLELPKTQFIWLFLPVVVGLVSGSFAAGRWAFRMSSTSQMRTGRTILMGAAALNVVFAWLLPAQLPWAVIFCGVYAFGVAIFLPSSTYDILERYGNERGNASSMLGFVQSVAFAAISACAPLVVFGSALRYALAMLFAIGVAVFLSRMMFVQKRPLV
ncbi:multidrug effflux MFS transporter [Paraburkholderia sp. J67]|uniref:multidrug effflux MFS transporter n=1 Tax=Paraburkholderia sp. J67 TaxID=2805435 RepID=UPI002ABE5FCD|nr:multidrug effflux MFS transporter [Paraburkholderia sp. J67]